MKLTSKVQESLLKVQADLSQVQDLFLVKVKEGQEKTINLFRLQSTRYQQKLVAAGCNCNCCCCCCCCNNGDGGGDETALM